MGNPSGIFQDWTEYTTCLYVENYLTLGRLDHEHVHIV